MDKDFLNEFRSLKRLVMAFGAIAVLTLLFTLASPIVHVLVLLYAGILFSVFLNGLAELVKLFPPDRRSELRDTLDSIGVALQKWLIGRVVVMASVGVLTTVGLIAAGIPNSLALGLLAGLLAFVPFLGPIIAVVPAFLVAFIKGPTLMIPVAIIFLVVHAIGGYLVTPLIQQRAVSLSPVVLLTSQVVIGLLLGVPGIIIATPLTITIIVIIQKSYIEGYLGDSVEILGQGS